MTAIPMPLAIHEVGRALDIARALAAVGVPLFIAPPDRQHPAGFALPEGWQRSPADPSVVDRWRSGWALCAVGGAACDFVDTDPRNGGTASREQLQTSGRWPASYGRAATPSGGTHDIIAPLSVGKATPAAGIDLQGGRRDGSGRGFVFLAPTERASKVDGVRRTYRWLVEPDISALRQAASDRSGAALAELVKVAAPLRVQNPARRPAEFFCDFTPAEAQQAIATCIENVRAHAKAGWSGFRNTLNRAAYTLGGLVATGYLSESDAEKRLLDAITAAGHAPNDDDCRWVEEGIEDGCSEPMWVRLSEPKAPPPSFARPSAGNLPDEFWEARPLLTAIRCAAHSQARSADAVLGVLLARLSSLLPGTLRVDTGVGSPASLNYYSVLMGTAGAGKTTAADIAYSLLPWQHDADSEINPIGSGQGIAAAYGMVVDGEFKQCNTKAFFYADEGAQLMALARNRENTTMATLRQAWTGHLFGQRNATAGLNRRVEKYSMGLWVGLQPMHAAQLFADLSVDDGTLQRFVWWSATDPTIKTRQRRKIPLCRLDWDLGHAWNAHQIEVPDWLKDELFARDVAIQRGELVLEPGCEHEALVKIKTAGLLAIYDGRHEVDTTDWELAGQVFTTSRSVAQRVRDDMESRAKLKETKELAKRHRIAAADDAHAEKLVESKTAKLAIIARDQVSRRPGLPKTHLARSVRRHDLPLAHAAIELAITNGWLREETSHRGSKLWPV